ncbi:MAG: SdpI family protein [Pyrinomonadaceae bacterium]|nr:SdpI family protein [Pyrinomonadaceae bacterium]
MAIVLILVNIPLYQGKIKRNNWYGFRTPRTLASDEVWYPVNKEAGLNFIIASVITLITSIVLFFLREIIPQYVLVVILVVVTMFTMIGAVVKSFIFLRKLA